jgi:hypothetical protein
MGSSDITARVTNWVTAMTDRIPIEVHSSVHGHFSSSPTITAFHPLPDDHPCYRLVGLIAAETARIDFLLDQSIADAGGIDRQLAACITGQITSTIQRFDALFQLCRHRGLDEEITTRIKSLAGEAGQAYGPRNRAVHDPWMQEQVSGASYQFRGKPRKSPDFGNVPVSLADLESHWAELKRVRERVVELIGDIWAALRA